MIDLLKPPKLNHGDTIGIVATSYPLPITDFPDSEYVGEYRKGVKEIESMGFKVKEGKNIDKVKWWYAGTPQERAYDINNMFADPEVKAIIVHEGGQSAIAVLEYIDYELVKKNPKPFIGFSDITNIHTALYTKAGLVGFHGPLVTYSLGRVWDEHLPEKKEKAKERLYSLLTSTEPLGKIEQFTQWETWRSGSAKGKLFGGNIANFLSVIGTPYFPKIEDLEGCILFWEIDGVQSYKIEKCLYHLKYAGVLDNISGMLIGKLPDITRTAWRDFTEPTVKEIIMDVLKDYSFPIIAEVDFGHKTVDTVMPIGIEVQMNANTLELEFLAAAVR